MDKDLCGDLCTTWIFGEVCALWERDVELNEDLLGNSYYTFWGVFNRPSDGVVLGDPYIASATFFIRSGTSVNEVQFDEIL